MASRVPFLARLARRYAMRHKGQTARAVLGLLIATTVLAMGLGMGESIAVSLERAALAQFGPIDITLNAQQPFDASLGDALPERAGLARVDGAASLDVVGAVSNPRTGLAEAFSSIRGVSPQEAQSLGPLLRAGGGGTVPDPASGEVVLSEDLAQRLDARVGDTVLVRAPRPDASPTAGFETFNVTGTAGLPGRAPEEHAFAVREGAIGVGAQMGWDGAPGGTVRVTLRAPSGVEFANESASAPLTLLVPGPVEAGTWTLTVTSGAPVVYIGGAGTAYPEGLLAAATVAFEARVSAIAETEGRAAITRRPAALLPLDDMQRALDAEGRATSAYYRVTGDPYEARDALEAALPVGQREQFEIRAAKADAIENAQEAGAEITGFLLVMGGFTLIAAGLLAFTLFSALVEERRAELGIARALGLTRGEVALSMTMEGAVYAFASAVVGLLLGLGLLWVLLSYIGAEAAAQGAPEFAVHVSPTTLVLALAIGTLIPLVTIAVASLRFARLDPARAIRGIPDDPKGKRRLGLWMAAALAIVGALACIDPVWRLLGVPILFAAAALALSSFGRWALALLAAAGGVAHIAWSLYTFNSFPDDADELDPVVTLSRGALLAMGLAALAVASSAPYEMLLRAIGRGGAAKRSAWVAIRYLVARRRPVGLTMAMIALVVVVVTVMGTLFASFGGSIPDNEAGYHVLGEAAVAHDGFPRAPPPDVAAMIDRADFLPRHVEFRQANVTRDGEGIGIRAGMRQFVGVTEPFARANEYVLGTRAAEYATDEDAWAAVARGEAILPPAWALENNGLRAGDRVTLQTAAFGPKPYVIAGGVDSDFVFQTFLPAEDVRAMGFPQATQAYLRVAEGADPDTLARRLAALYAEDGITFTSIPEEVARITQNIQALVLVFEAFLALGLFVGLAATGFLASRAVHERMREIGTLRALGFEERDVRLAFMLESTFTAAIGLLLGTLAGLLVAHSVWWRELRPGDDGPFRPPWLILGSFALAVLTLAALSAMSPARRAAKLPPALAVRHVE